MFCPKCGKEIKDGDVFCPYCGEKTVKKQDQIQVQNNNVNKKSNKKKSIIIILVVLVFFILLISLIVFGIKSLFGFFNRYINTGDKDNSISIVMGDYNIPKFIDGNFTDIVVKDEKDALKALNSLKNQMKFNNVENEFEIDSVNTVSDITYYKFQQIYLNTRVYNNNLIIAVDKNGKVLSMSGYYVPNIQIDVNEKLSVDQIKEMLNNNLGGNVEFLNVNKYVYANDTSSQLIYVVDTYRDGNFKSYIVDANDGSILISNDGIDNVAYDFTGNGINGVVDVIIDGNTDNNWYRLVDPKRNIFIVDGRHIGADISGVAISSLFSSWNPMEGIIDRHDFKYATGDGGDKEIAEIGLTALKNYEDIYDFYKSLGSKSYDNKGGKIVVNIGVRSKTFGSETYQNASWLSLNNQMYIGYRDTKSFVIARDVLGHEFTHGIINHTSNFSKSPKKGENNKPNESGALNEGIADIIGTLFEGKNWTMSEDVGIIRNISNPELTENPREKGGDYYYPDYYQKGSSLEEFLTANSLSDVYDYDFGGVHKNSTVVSHSAYLMYKNGAFSSMQEEAEVWYNALFLMSSYSKFDDCALAVIKTAKNLGLSAKSISIIEDAFYTTKMLEGDKKENKASEDSDKNNKCKSHNCNSVTFYVMVPDENNKFVETKEVYYYDHGTVISSTLLVETINGILGNSSISSEDGKTIEIAEGMDMALYYRGTDEKFDFNQPITEDIELEFKFMDGMLDNNTIKEIAELFNK